MTPAPDIDDGPVPRVGDAVYDLTDHQHDRIGGVFGVTVNGGKVAKVSVEFLDGSTKTLNVINVAVIREYDWQEYKASRTESEIGTDKALSKTAILGAPKYEEYTQLLVCLWELGRVTGYTTISKDVEQLRSLTLDDARIWWASGGLHDELSLIYGRMADAMNQWLLTYSDVLEVIGAVNDGTE